MDQFTLTENHLKLLKNANIRWNDLEVGAPEIDCKRPYGSSDLTSSLKRILPNHTEFELMKLHHETEFALQIVLATGTFVTGIYERKNEYDSSSWILIKEG